MKLKILQNWDQPWQNLEVEVTEKTEIYQKSVKDIHRTKKNCIEFCMKELKAEELGSEKKSIELIGKFQSYKKHIMRELEDVDDKDDKMQILKKYEDDINNKVNELESKLMEFEMTLQDALNRATETLKEKVGIYN